MTLTLHYPRLWWTLLRDRFVPRKYYRNHWWWTAAVVVALMALCVLGFVVLTILAFGFTPRDDIRGLTFFGGGLMLLLLAAILSLSLVSAIEGHRQVVRRRDQELEELNEAFAPIAADLFERAGFLTPEDNPFHKDSSPR